MILIIIDILQLNVVLVFVDGVGFV